MKPITYSLQFRGHAADAAGALRKQARAPGCALVTSLASSGVESRWVWSPDDEEALLESVVVLADDGRFDEDGTIHFSPSHALHIRGTGHLAPSPDPHLMHGASVWEVVGGRGQFDAARGRITSNFFLSDTGELTENQLGVVFPSAGERSA